MLLPAVPSVTLLLYIIFRLPCFAARCSLCFLASQYGQRGRRAASKGLFWELNPGPLAPEARIMPLDQTASGLLLRLLLLRPMLCMVRLRLVSLIVLPTSDLVLSFWTYVIACGDSAVGSA